MTWTDAYLSISTDWHAVAELIAMAWTSAADSHNAALLSNLICNQLTPVGVCSALDASSIPFPTLK
jgi:hypothetical protein